MNKFFSAALALALCTTLFGCESNIDKNQNGIITDDNMQNTENQNSQNGEMNSNMATQNAKVALITYGMSDYDGALLGDVMDIVENYASQNDVDYDKYEAEDRTDAAYLNAIRDAAEDGANVIVLKGQDFEVAVFHAQELYPDIDFILIDGVPNNGDNPPVYRTNSNVANIMFADEQAGYLAGYASVKEGYTKLGFIGYKETSPAAKYASGFAQGAEAAAKEGGISNVSVRYQYLDDFTDMNKLKNITTDWYGKDVQLIAVYGDMLTDAAVTAAQGLNKKIILASPYDDKNDSFLASSSRNIDAAINKVVQQHFAGTFPGGQNIMFDASNGGIGISMQNTGFTKFNEKNYQDIFSKLSDGTVKVDSEKAINELSLSAVKVENVK